MLNVRFFVRGTTENMGAEHIIYLLAWLEHILQTKIRFLMIRLERNSTH